MIIAGVPSLRSIDGYNSRLGVLAEHHSAGYNQTSAELAGRSTRTSFAALSPALADSQGHGRATQNYMVWGAEIAEITAPLLDTARAAARPVAHDAAKSEPQRRDSIRKLSILHTAPEARFDRIVQQARIGLNATAAALGFIDDDQIWFKSAIGTTLPEIPFVDSFTGASLDQRGAIFVPDARADPRFRHLVHVTGDPWIRFWAGFPIEDDHGVRVGTLSVFDPQPRIPAAARDAAVLRQLARTIQDELRKPAQTETR